jgi:hypothetical protein
VSAVIAQGYPYELVGILYYGLFLVMGRKQFVARYTNRSRYLALGAGMAMVGCVPFGYAKFFAGDVVMVGLAVAALVSTFIDALADRRKGRPS